ncbi:MULTISPECIES: hypothetical protein [unclassified Methanoregula]|uniref:hypothetical protein n=1 Tax=unclassified Methanoregula TaxID=2649730 RepID=UPI0009C9D0B2|nr:MULTISPECIES: hypothetical protein [unclassified Methanoregula]OPX63001.1 MAG: hypothetical protein A4E33_01932 [Methanoregula sp. PtaB.Bin085]OPY31579.1 MAG: hypothetical protein A4E34_02772 [Methanoregula sp. PtaU1.Bin006]
MVNDRWYIFIVAVVLVLLGIAIFFFTGMFHTLFTPHTSYKTPTGIITIWIPLPDTPQNISRFHVVSQENDTAYYSVTNLEQTRLNVTSEIDSPQVAQTVLKDYGGLPEEAILIYNKTEYLEEKSGTTHQVIASYPISTNVQFGRKLNGIPVTGEGGFINIDLGTDGELLYLNKVWRTVEPAGTEKIIPISKAIERLGQGEVLNPKKCFCDLNVDRIYIAYWEKGAGVPQEYLDPVWVFSGTTDSGEVINYKVYARDGPDPRFPAETQHNIKDYSRRDYLLVTPPDHLPDGLPETNGPSNITENSGNIS